MSQHFNCISMSASFERSNGANLTGRPHFITILSPESLIMLIVPRNFVKHLDKSALKSTVTLFSPRNNFWHVQVLLNQDDELDVKFGKGWELFVRAHSLKPGDAILFRYEGNVVFSVQLFHSDGCCIVQDLTVNRESFKPPTIKTADEERKKKSKSTGGKAKVSEKRSRRFEWILRSYNVDPARAIIYLPYLPEGLVSEAKKEAISLDCLGRLWPVRLWVGKQFAITSGWKQLVKEMKLKEGDKCVFETISERVLGLKIDRQGT